MAPHVDAVILAGGRGSRLGGADKASLIGPDGRTTLERTILACDDLNAGRIVVVGPPDRLSGVANPNRRSAHLVGSARVEITQEHPPGSGPARAIAAGVTALTSGSPSGANVSDAPILVLACDMPNAAPGVRALVRAGVERDGSVAVVNGRRQWLFGLFRRAALVGACAALDGWSGGGDPSARRLLGELDLVERDVPAGAADDLDTPADLEHLHFSVKKGMTMDNTDEMTKVGQWLDVLRASIDLSGLEAVDAQDLLDTVRAVAHGIIHAAGPVAAFAAGYAAAKAGGSGQAVAKTLSDVREAAASFGSAEGGTDA